MVKLLSVLLRQLLKPLDFKYAALNLLDAFRVNLITSMLKKDSRVDQVFPEPLRILPRFYPENIFKDVKAFLEANMVFRE